MSVMSCQHKSLIWGTYQALTALSAPILSGLLRKRLEQGKEIPERYREKQGITATARPDGALIWLHGASVGESLSMLPLITMIQKEFPERPILVTTGTKTSAELMQKRLPANVIHQFYPLDHPSWVKRFLDHWRPALAIWLESELWPNMLFALRDKEVPVVLLNGRMSDQSFARWQKWPQTIGNMLDVFDVIMAQSQHDFDYYRQLTRRDVQMPGNLKYAAGDLPADENMLSDLRHVIGDRPVWCAASTHPGEEEEILKAHQIVLEQYPDCLLILVPRHPERGSQLQETLDISHIGMMARRADGQNLDAETSIYLADTLGEMGLWYRLAPIVFVGGSLKPIGGHNPLEPARLGCAVMFGPEMFNFKEMAQRFVDADTNPYVQDGADLGQRVVAFLREPQTRDSAAQSARALALNETSVGDRVFKAILPLLQKTA